MCQHDPSQIETLARQTALPADVMVLTQPPQPARGSRRRRLWELGDHAHCPVIGVCLPIGALRRLLDKALGGRAVAGDYEVHCGVVADCKQRGKLAEAVQRELDRRYMKALRQAAAVKTSEALARWWEQISHDNLAGALWATLTHPRCTTALEHDVLGRVHMVQHQVGAAQRADLQRIESLLDENAVLTRALGQAQQRNTRLTDEQARRSEEQQSQIVQLRADLIGRDTVIAALKEALQSLEAAAPGLKTRFELARQSQQQIERIHQLERALLESRQEAERQRSRADNLAEQLHRCDHNLAPTVGAEANTPGLRTRLDDRAVLCVGGRQASVPIYRQLIEHIGGRFLHHDGGDEESPAKLDATLSAADLVICQTGCISHDAYWRVKDHCKRTGKRCLFVDTPSRTALTRALEAIDRPDAF